MGMILWTYVAKLKWFWWELDRKIDLIRNLIFYQDNFFIKVKTLKKNTLLKIQKIMKNINHLIFLGN